MNPRMALCGVGLALFVGTVFSVPAGAQFFAGIDVSYTETVFRPEYSYAYDRPNSQYENTAYGVDLDVVGGYRIQPDPMFSFAVAGSLGFSDARWSLRTSDPDTHLKYSIPYRVFITLQPSVHVTERVRLFGELGGGQGYVEQKKTSDVSSRYDESTWIWGYRLGAGVGYELCPGWELALAYRHVSYEKFSYDTHLPDGTHWETVRDKPYADNVVLSLTRFW